MPCSVIVSGAESGDQLPHTDVSTAPDMLPARDRNPSSCHILTFVALFPQYRINVQAGTAMGEAKEERWDEVCSNRGRSSSSLAPPKHHGLPSPPPRARDAGGAVHAVDPRSASFGGQAEYDAS